jgi:hypothetical protein
MRDNRFRAKRLKHPSRSDAINEAEAVFERSGERAWCAELHRFPGVFLAATGANETEVEATFSAAIRTARDQKSTSLEKRAEGTYAKSHAKSEGVRRTWISNLFDNFL